VLSDAAYIVAVGDGKATVDAIVNRSGEYESGWIAKSERERLNLATVVSIRLTLDSDEPMSAFG
jgi:hypothetical protein